MSIQGRQGVSGEDSRQVSRELVQFFDTVPPPPGAETDPTSTHFGTLDSSDSGSRWKRSYGPGTPDPWISRKGAVIFLIALTLWSFYVVVGRVCAPAIRNRSEQGYSLATGVGTMIGFVILWLLYAVSYFKMITTGPGFAKDYVAKSPPPPPNPPSTTFIPYRSPGSGISDSAGPDPSVISAVPNAIGSALQHSFSHQQSSSATLRDDAPRKGVDNGTRTKTGRRLDEIERPVPRVDSTPRWCRYCQIYKPDRTHHCRHCGTCVMQFDHHCIWLGKCCGWANHKFFIVFTFWASIFCAYIVIFLGITLSRSDSVDGQIIGLTACAGLFLIFSASMFPSHVYLILDGKTTVESYAGRDQVEMETSLLHREFGYVFNDHNKRIVRKRWKEEFGGVNVDDRWRVGTWKDRWKTEMGTGWLGWILPLGRPQGDGLNYPSHHGFGPNGEWLKKKDWPTSTH